MNESTGKGNAVAASGDGDRPGMDDHPVRYSPFPIPRSCVQIYQCADLRRSQAIPFQLHRFFGDRTDCMLLILLCQDLMDLFQLTYSLQHVSCGATALSAIQQQMLLFHCYASILVRMHRSACKKGLVRSSYTADFWSPFAATSA